MSTVDPNDTFLFHEIVDRSCLLANAVSDQLLEHPVVKEHVFLLELAKIAETALSLIYKQAAIASLESRKLGLNQS